MTKPVESIAWFWLIALYLLGFALLFSELFIPSAGILGLVGFLLCGYSIYELFAAGEDFAAWSALVVSVLYSVVLVRWWLVKITDTSNLGAENASGSDVKEAATLVGVAGVAKSDLRPAGIAEIDGRRLDVVATGGFVDAGDSVVVTEVNGNRIVVRERTAKD